jgi:SOS response regulatory protein OraA/RecX
MEIHVLDDEAFARMWVESRDRARPRSEAALRGELAQKGIDRELAAQVLEERRARTDEEHSPGDGHRDTDLDTDRSPDAGPNLGADMMAAERLLRQRRGALARIVDARERRRRAYALLARNGFDPEVCREATLRFTAATAEANT